MGRIFAVSTRRYFALRFSGCMYGVGFVLNHASASVSVTVTGGATTDGGASTQAIFAFTFRFSYSALTSSSPTTMDCV